MKRCPYCAEEIQDAAVVCKHCQRDLKTGKGATQIVVKPASDWISTTAKWGVTIFLILFVFGIFAATCKG